MPLDRIVTTAISILDEQGADALSMRTLALRLESSTSTLYRHFAGRADLVARVNDTVVGEVDLDFDELRTLPWGRAWTLVGHRMFDVLRAHPQVAALMVERMPSGPNMLALRENMLALMLNSGFSPSLAIQSWATLARYVLGFGVQLRAAGSGKGSPAVPAKIDATRFPATDAVAQHFPIPLEREFSFGLDLLISGLEHRAGGVSPG